MDLQSKMRSVPAEICDMDRSKLERFSTYLESHQQSMTAREKKELGSLQENARKCQSSMRA